MLEHAEVPSAISIKFQLQKIVRGNVNAYMASILNTFAFRVKGNV